MKYRITASGLGVAHVFTLPGELHEVRGGDSPLECNPLTILMPRATEPAVTLKVEPVE